MKSLSSVLKILASGLFGLTLAALPAQAGSVRLEADQVSLNNTLSNPTFNSVAFRQSYFEAPLVFATATTAGGQPAALQVRNVTTTGFEITMKEPPNQDGGHVSMTIDYFAIEPGQLDLGGLLFEARRHATATTVQSTSAFPSAGGHDRVNFESGFGSAPAVLGQIQTQNNEQNNVPVSDSSPWLTTSIDDVNDSGLDIALDRSETNDGSTVGLTEEIGFLAASDGRGSFVDNAGNTIDFESIRSGDVFQGWDNSEQTETFASFGQTPLAVATKNTRDGGDGGWLRRGTLTDGEIGLVVDEDTFHDGERNHTTERAGILLFEQAFDANILEPNTVRWDNQTGSEAWGTAANWDPDQVPDLTIQALFDLDSETRADLPGFFGGPGQARQLTFRNDGFNIAGGFFSSLEVRDGIDAQPFDAVDATYTIDPGFVTLTGDNTWNVENRAGGTTTTLVVDAFWLTTEGELTVTGDGDVSVSGFGVTLGGDVTYEGSGSLAFSGTTMDLNGADRTFGGDGTGDWDIDAGITGAGKLTKRGTSTLTLGGGNDWSGGTDILGGTLEIGASANLPSDNNSAITLDGGRLRATADVTLDDTRDFTVGASGGAFGVTAGSTLRVEGDLGGSADLEKTGDGTFELAGSHLWSGSMDVLGGRVDISGDVDSAGGFDLASTTSLVGQGSAAGATISGSGMVEPGPAADAPNSDGVLTANRVESSSGLDFKFEFTQLGSPTYNQTGNSGNDVLRLTDPNLPFSGLDFTSDTEIDIFFNTALSAGDVLRGGFFTDREQDFLSQITGAEFNFFEQDPSGSVVYRGQTFKPFATSMTTVMETADFGGGGVNGYTLQFTIPLPPGAWMGLTGIGLVGLLLWRRRYGSA